MPICSHLEMEEVNGLFSKAKLEGFEELTDQMIGKPFSDYWFPAGILTERKQLVLNAINMKAEDITKSPSGYIKCTLNGIKIEGSEDQVNAILHANGCEPLKFEPRHWSNSKQKWIPINEMSATHVVNYLQKAGDIDDYFVENFKTNHNNFRDYMRRLVEAFDNY